MIAPLGPAGLGPESNGRERTDSFPSRQATGNHERDGHGRLDQDPALPQVGWVGGGRSDLLRPRHHDDIVSRCKPGTVAVERKVDSEMGMDIMMAGCSVCECTGPGRRRP
jgi:hypothetical protein